MREGLGGRLRGYAAVLVFRERNGGVICAHMFHCCCGERGIACRLEDGGGYLPLLLPFISKENLSACLERVRRQFRLLVLTVIFCPCLQPARLQTSSTPVGTDDKPSAYEEFPAWSNYDYAPKASCSASVLHFVMTIMENLRSVLPRKLLGAICPGAY